jgi:GntR family transcriptional regulator
MSRPRAAIFDKPEQASGRRRRVDEAARIRDLLRAEIISGRYRERSLLPGEPEIMLEYAAGRNVVRDALDQLRTEGLVERIPGSGTFALSTKAQHRFDHAHCIRDDVLNTRSVSGAVVSMITITAPRVVAEQLQLKPGEECIFMEYTTFISAAPFTVTASYLPMEVGVRIDRDAFAGDFFQMLESAGFAPGFGDMTMEAASADERSAAMLQIEPGSPLMLFHRKVVSSDGSPLEVGFVRSRGDRLSLRLRLPRAVNEGSP